ncbi:MAG: ParA family protein [Candidatus Izemoplasmatales bacterium]|nr:ParA family protein [Candidatus Izemoplasmatales bacterium]
MIVLFGHQKGGVGKSTVAINFAYEMQKKHKSITLLDLDSQNSAILFNQLRANEDLATIKCVKESDVEFTSFINEYANNKENLLIIDSGGYDSDVNRAALLKADMIITPVGISQIEIFGLQKFRKILIEASDALGTDIKTNVLLNNVDSRSKNKLKELREYISDKKAHFNLLESVIYTRADLKNSYGEGLTVSEYNKKGSAAKEIKKLVKEVRELLKN